MKKLSAILAAFGLITTCSTFAAVEMNKAPTTGYKNNLTTQAKATSQALTAGQSGYYQTDITVVNGSIGYIHSMVVDNAGNPIYDVYMPPIKPNDHIQHPTWRGATHVAFRNASGGFIFDAYVCRLAVVSLFGGPYYYQWNIDETLCTRP